MFRLVSSFSSSVLIYKRILATRHLSRQHPSFQNKGLAYCDVSWEENLRMWRHCTRCTVSLDWMPPISIIQTSPKGNQGLFHSWTKAWTKESSVLSGISKHMYEMLIISTNYLVHQNKWSLKCRPVSSCDNEGSYLCLIPDIVICWPVCHLCKHVTLSKKEKCLWSHMSHK